MAKKPLEIDMIAGSQLRDTQGEMLSVEGADISELEAGRGRLNDNHGKGFFNAIGRITGAKKIFKKEDCENERQEYYWSKVKAPFIFVKGYLYDDEDHPNARAAAAILRNIHKADTPLQLKASVEGGVLSRGISDNSLLARTKIHSVALTFTPANNNTLVEPTSLIKSDIDEAADMLLIKSVLHLAETNVPSFRHIMRDASATKVQNNLIKLVDLMKDLGIEGEISIPSKQKILEKALEQKVQNNIQEIKERITTLNDSNKELMEKGFKNAIAGAVTGAALSMAPTHINKEKVPTAQVQQKPKRTHEQVFHDVVKQYPLLGAIGQIESGGGANLEHQTLQSGMHKGHTAGGTFGMMPTSAAFILQKDPELAKKYPKLVDAAKDVNKNHLTFTKTFNQDPEAAADFAISAFKRSKSKTKGEKMLTYSWLNGLKGSWNKYKESGNKAFDEHPYVQKVMEEYSKLKPKKVEQKKPLNKALMAGYGGAGAPTSRVSGAVIQAESLDSKSGFKYITCDNCGKEQIHAKHQVKCRECGHGMSFEKLYSTMRGNNK
jgi:ribosomal protein S27E